MNTEFMTADTNLPPCLPLPGAMLGLPVSSTAKVMYARLLGEIYTAGTEDINGILFVQFPIVELAAAPRRGAPSPPMPTSLSASPCWPGGSPERDMALRWS